MWRTKLFGLALFGLTLSSCKTSQFTEAEQMRPSVAEDFESEKTEKNYDSPYTMRKSYTLPKVVTLVVEDNMLKLKLRLNGKCEEHELKWVEKADCTFEIHDLTRDDKCMGYQYVEKEYDLDFVCEAFTINGFAYP